MTELYNVQLTRYTDNQIRPLHELAKSLGVLIHIDGIPYGADIENPNVDNGDEQSDD